MIDSTIHNALVREMSQLPEPLQQKVVEYAHSLVRSVPEGTPGDRLLRFAGILTPEEARDMMEAIEQECERIEPDEG